MPVSTFVHQSFPGRVLFGTGAVDRVADEVAALPARRVLLVVSGSATRVGQRLRDQLGDRVAGTIGEVAPHVPEPLAAAARQRAAAVDADCVVCTGGGSATGLAKAIAVATGTPIVAVPTTYAGSEMTAIYGITGEHKTVRRDDRARPRVVVYDPALTLSLPARTTATSGFNAMAHAVAALLSAAATPVTDLLATEAIRCLVGGLPRAVSVPSDVDARAQALLGAYLAGSAIATTGSGLHHRLCHILGGDFQLVHADVHTVLLPHTVALAAQPAPAPAAPAPLAPVPAAPAPAAPAQTTPAPTTPAPAPAPTQTASAHARLDRVAAALDGDSPAASLYDLATALGAPTSLAELGLPPEALDGAAQRGAEAAARHPNDHAPPDVPAIRALLDAAYAGRRP